MSLSRSRPGERDRALGEPTGRSSAVLRGGALASTLALTASYVGVLWSVTGVVGGRETLLVVVLGALAAGTLLARFVPVPVATLLGIVAFLGGFAAYVHAVPDAVALPVLEEYLLEDTVALLTGLSVLRMVEAGTWAISFAPAPVFLSWYLALRRRYAIAGAVGLLTLSMLVLTGDAGLSVALLGVLGAAGAVGFGELERRGARPGQSDVLAVVLSLMLVSTLTVTVVPGGASSPLMPEGEAETESLDDSLAGTDEEITIAGSVDLTPEVRFTVESDEPAYWRTGAYDRYTGDGWVQSGETRAYDGPLNPPPGETETVEQRVEAETDLAAMPAAWQPVEVDEGAENARLSNHGGLQPAEPFEEGEGYTVESERPDPSGEELRDAGTDYPEDVEERYTQLPEDTPDRVGEYTDSLTEDAETPYEQAAIVERHLSSEWGYTLDVERPEGDVADATLFELDAAYCTYFATTMVAMLRSQDVPARFVTGYTAGEEVDEDRYEVRGLNAHAWVEVYFPDQGWVEFDPTPPARDEVHEDQLDGVGADVGAPDAPEAAETERAPQERDDADEEPDVPADVEGDDPAPETDETDDADPESDDDPVDLSGSEEADDDGEQPDADEESPSDDADDASESEGTDADSDDGPALPPIDPSRELLLVLGAIAVGLVGGAHRVGLVGEIGPALVDRLRRGGGANTPEATVERAYDRLERRLEADHRERREGESVRSFVAALPSSAVDERTDRVVRLYERARYGPGVSEAEAEEAVELVEGMVDGARIPRPFRGGRS